MLCAGVVAEPYNGIDGRLDGTPFNLPLELEQDAKKEVRPTTAMPWKKRRKRWKSMR
jgi:hypothetical protein